jgi:hypothetical protein
MAGVRNLRKVQIGKEAAGAGAGTEVDATAVMRLNGMIEDTRKVVFPEEYVGYLSRTDRNYSPQLGAAINLTGEATFEQLGYILNCGVEGVAGVKDGAGTGYVYTHTMPTTALKTLYTYTIEAGDNQQAEILTYGYCPEFTLSGKYGEAWMLDATIHGQQAALTSFTGALAPTAVEEILFGKTKLYIDASSGNVGATLKSNTLLEASLKVTTGWIEKYTADGALYFSFINCVDPEVILDITFEHDTTSVAEKAAWRAGSTRLVRLLSEGTALGTAGTAYTYKTMKIDLAGAWEKFEKIDEIDGNDVVKGSLRCRFNAAEALFGVFVVVNSLTALP